MISNASSISEKLGECNQLSTIKKKVKWRKQNNFVYDRDQ